MDHSQHRFVTVQQPYQHPVERHAVDERRGAVDRIHGPAAAAFAVHDPELLPQDAVQRAAVRDPPSQELLRAAVGVGDGGPVRLGVEAQRGAEALQRDPPGRARRVDRERAQLGQLRRIDHNDVNSASSIVVGSPMTTKWMSLR